MFSGCEPYYTVLYQLVARIISILSGCALPNFDYLVTFVHRCGLLHEKVNSTNQGAPFI